MPTTKKQTKRSTLDEIRMAVTAIEDKKGESIRVLDVRGKSSITDYLVLSTGTSEPHLKALKGALDKVLKEAGVHLIGEDREVGSGWLIVDAFDFMVHLQTQEMRELYQLDRLWADALEVTL
ncbi:MAG: ribosome silencing factor [Opitutales bacterium]|jgi:ribosome-associated protein|nr:ribosome silencing factor [Opitutales bacterium]MDP4642969.1 ribosome silencing factor [Opitutales bacterium]MDP4776525.1 ribosome silencing factor [Opitutales bacterium]MDP4884427.1 ribosome silencing factor [Opitutales bacterium]MDP5079321.1 ribosome silencing factor [Opitutales bacterium]